MIEFRTWKKPPNIQKKRGKKMRKIVAIVLCLSVLLTLSPIAFAVAAEDDGGYNFKGVYRVQQGRLINVKVPESIRKVENHSFYIDDENVAVSTDEDETGNIAIVGRLGGATVITFESYKVTEETIDGETHEVCEVIETINYVILVFDEEDAKMTGKVTGVTVDDVKCHYGDFGRLDFEVTQDGEVGYETIVFFDDYCFDFYDNGEFEAYDHGHGKGVLYVIDTNGNIVSETFTATATFTPVQWVNYILMNIYYFFTYWFWGYDVGIIG